MSGQGRSRNWDWKESVGTSGGWMEKWLGPENSREIQK